jgi:hypothetical protein
VLATEPKKDENQQKSEDQRHRPKDKRRAEISKAEPGTLSLDDDALHRDHQKHHANPKELVKQDITL